MTYTQTQVDCRIDKAKCCYASLVYDLAQADMQGNLPQLKCLSLKVDLVGAYIKALCGYKVVGEQLTVGEYAKWALYIDDARIGHRIVVTLYGTDYSFFFTTDDSTAAATELLAYLNTQGFSGYITNEGYMVILAAEVGTEYNGDTVTISYAYNYEIVGQTGTVSGIHSGIYQGGVNPTYQEQTTIDNEQADAILGNLSLICNCGC